jgi:hypothetical protein
MPIHRDHLDTSCGHLDHPKAAETNRDNPKCMGARGGWPSVSRCIVVGKGTYLPGSCTEYVLASCNCNCHCRCHCPRPLSVSSASSFFVPSTRSLLPSISPIPSSSRNLLFLFFAAKKPQPVPRLASSWFLGGRFCVQSPLFSPISGRCFSSPTYYLLFFFWDRTGCWCGAGNLRGTDACVQPPFQSLASRPPTTP